MSDKSSVLREQTQPVASCDTTPPDRALASGGPRRRLRLLQGLALLLFAIVPATVVQFFAEPPTVRHLHVEAFRYGKDPSVIRCNRGDELHLTFSSRDTGHSFFLEEFDVDAKITPGSRNIAVFRTTEPEQAPDIKQELVLKTEHPGWLRYLVSKSQYRCHVWCGPMHAFEHGNLIIGPNTLLYAGLGLLLGIPFAGWMGIRRDMRLGLVHNSPVGPQDGWDVLRRFPRLKRWMKSREFQFIWMLVSAVLLYLVVLTSIFGTKVAGRNFGVMVTWVLWMFLLTVILTPFGGRLWCMACPLPAFGDFAQRRMITGVRQGRTKRFLNKFFGLNLSWPQWLANDWPRTFVFLGFGTFSAALVAYPRFTGFAILGLIVLATLMAPIWELRAFCRYLCPVTGFVGLYGKSGKLALRVVDSGVCSACKVHTCLLGSAKGWACPWGLCAADLNDNTDCGMCTECIKTCTYDNVTFRMRPFAHETSVRSYGQAWLAIGMLVLATAYSLVHLGHWPALRDAVNILDKANWGQFAIFSLVLWMLTLVMVPAVMLGVAYLGKRLAHLSQSPWEVMKDCTGTLIPLGLLVWIAFVIPMLTVNMTFLLQSLSDPFGWGWNLFGFAGSAWHQVWPRAIPWLQVACLAMGLGYSLRNGWRIWLGLSQEPRAALRGMFPLSLLLLLYAGSMVWFFAN